MTTHFTSGVTNVKAEGTGGRLKTPDPIKYHMYHNDFDKFVAADYTITTTEAGGGDATETIITGDGGLLKITNDAADDDLDFLQWKGHASGTIENYKYEAPKDLYYSVRFQTNDATQSELAIGLIITDTDPFTSVTDGIFFRKADGDATLQFVVEKDGTESTLDVAELADDTFITVGFYYDTKDRKFHVYKNNNEIGKVVNTNAPDDEELAISFGIKNGAAAAKSLTLDYINVGKERTADTEL